ncbi:MAG: sulfatase-like hydrolase/transferase [Rikenellaceae bacterium]
MNGKNILLASCLLTLSSAAVAKPSLGRPNVIFIYADDMGKGMLSAYGQQFLQTPNIDKIVKGGLEFSNAYGGHFSSPARAMLLTGYSDCRADIFTIGKGGQFKVDTSKIANVEATIDAQRVRLADNDDYLGEMFQRAGYTTAQVGKLGYAFCSTRREMTDQGWDYYYGFLDHVRCHGYFPPFLFNSGRIDMIEGNTHNDCAKSGEPYDVPKNEERRLNMDGKVQYSQDLFNSWIRDFLRDHSDEPFFLYHPSQLPHGPLSVPELHEQVKDVKGLTHGEKEYATMMILLDEAVGMIMEEVERLGIADNTMFIFSSDNGHEIYTQTSNSSTSKQTIQPSRVKVDNSSVKYRSVLCGDIFDGNMGMAGLKRSNLEGGVCVPLAYYMPSKIEAGVSTDVVANYDFIATMADMLGVAINKNKDAVSYCDVLLNHKKRHLPADRTVVVDSYEGPMIVRNDGWKVRYNPVTQGFDLYSILIDKQERYEMNSKYPDILAQLRSELIERVERTMVRGEYPYLKENN